MADPQESVPGDTAGDPKTIVSSLAADWARLGLAGDVGGLVNLYKDDAIFFGSLPNMYFGLSGVAEYFRVTSLTSLKSVRFDWQEARFIAPSVINAGGLVHFGMEIESVPISWRFGMSWTLVRSGANWKIAAHHASRRELQPQGQ